ncbi:MAG TPA: rhomboid family intramembrane serine protease [Flavobacteriales bacterium]|jgi:membrane associated rhomboid family serine protease|nr:rhomboid family intramembrane serine protease [Flavobacteriales bacterium]HIB76270.1 rhomboid family intramembrane serine protease [Flavobacteriales bacterium]HIN41195.1 rhomboid family intramembrane serine protease [Flavobacteriales bacterium]HIO16555.1 rhomboid family intramembrane serine protease [Flavobacteriales bacterium]HIO60054.1 rhomboid family intramembrane serine protease [Flavobacteriales bacterium]
MFNNATTIVKNIIIINVIVFLGQGAFPEMEFWCMGHYPISPDFRPWQIVTHMFMHGGFTHLLFNMFALFVFGSALERAWGPKRFLTYYLLCGIGAFFLYQFTIGLDIYNQIGTFNPGRDLGWVLGASGSVFGLLLGFGMLFPNTQLMLLFPPIPIKAKYFVIGYGVIELLMAFRNSSGDNVAHFAHLGGMLIGYILIKKWQGNRKTFY